MPDIVAITVTFPDPPIAALGLGYAKASNVAVADLDGLFTSATVEGALRELALAGATPGGTSESGLSTQRAIMPTATAAPGAVGEYAVDGNELAIYVAGTGWLFFQGYQK